MTGYRVRKVLDRPSPAHELVRYSRRRTTLPWGSFPYDVSNASSDIRQAFHTRLCYAFRFSQPLDVLIPLASFRPCFVPNPSLGLWLSEVSPSQQPPRLSPRSIPRARRCVQARALGNRILAPGRSVHDEPVLPSDVGRSSPSLLPLRGILPSSLGLVFQQSLLSWAFPQRWTNPSLCRLSKISKNPKIG